MRKVKLHLMRKKDKPNKKDIEDMCAEIEAKRGAMGRIVAALDTCVTISPGVLEARRIAKEEA
jgi:hypothetical protein